jgi:hypothetical protein
MRFRGAGTKTVAEHNYTVDPLPGFLLKRSTLSCMVIRALQYMNNTEALRNLDIDADRNILTIIIDREGIMTTLWTPQ